MQKNGFLKLQEQKVVRNPLLNKNITRTKNLQFTTEQQLAYSKIADSIERKEFKKYLLEKENSQTIYEAVKNNFSKNKVYINALINSLTNSNIAQKYKENQEKYIEIMAQIFENYFLKNL